MDTNKATNPMSEYLLKIQMIVTNTEFKDSAEARQYETLESKLKGDAYVLAKNKTDVFGSYDYSNALMRSVLSEAFDEATVERYIKTPLLIPQKYKEILQAIARHQFLSAYKESNEYYLSLTGVPSSTDDEVMLPDSFYNIYASDSALQRNMPIHEMPYKYQELFINSDEYKRVLDEHPNLTYLRYLGSYAIPIEVSRAAKDGAILKINTDKLSMFHEVFGNVSVEPELVHLFINVYNKTRDYVYNTLRGDFSNIYANYDSFVRFLTIYLSIGNTLNELMKRATSMQYMNNASANNFFMLYGFPSSIMENANMLTFLKKFRLILMDKGTNEVYRVKDLVGYEYTDVYSLIMVKQQVFEDGVPIYIEEDGVQKPLCRIVFRRSGVANENTSYFKFREERKEFTLDEVTSGDPRWWNGKDVEQMITEMNYTLSNSKYIQLSTHMSMDDVFWQTSILLRGLLDRYQETMYNKMSINYSINGSSEMSVYEAVIVLIILMDWRLMDANGRSIKGELYLPNGTYNGVPACLDLLFNGLNEDGSPKPRLLGLPFKITSFNFDAKHTNRNLYDSIATTEYLDPDVLVPMIEKVINMERNNVGEVLMSEVKNIWKHLRDKLLSATTIEQFRQVIDVYQLLFLVDPIRDWYSNLPYNVDAILCTEFGISDNELNTFKQFFVEDNDDMTVVYDNKTYPISFFNIMNTNVTELIIQSNDPFNDEGFVEAFNEALTAYSSTRVEVTDRLSTTVKTNYKDIIRSKIVLDTGNTDNGPKTFDALLFRLNPSLYTKLLETRKDPGNTTMLIKSIIRGLESYTNAPLSGLQFKTLGFDEYFKTLKEVITYFKSYMVEFTNDEFVYIFGGIFDNGGNSDMLKLFDEISHARVRMVPKDSLTLFDVSKWHTKLKMPDHNESFLYDEALFRLKGTYNKIKSSGFEIWYDDGEWITTTPLKELTNDSIVVANVVPAGASLRIIITKDNII